MGTNPEGSRDLGGHAGSPRGAEERPLSAVPLDSPRTGATLVPPEPPARTGETVMAPEMPRTGDTVVPPPPPRTGATVMTPGEPVAAAPVVPAPRPVGAPPVLAPTLTSQPAPPPLSTPPSPGLPPGVRPPPSLLAVPPPVVASAEAEDEDEQEEETTSVADEQEYADEYGDPNAEFGEGEASDEGESEALGEGDPDLADVSFAGEDQEELPPEEDVSTGDYAGDEGENENDGDGGYDENEVDIDAHDASQDLTRHTVTPTSVNQRFVSVSSLDSFGDPEDFAVTGGRGREVDEDRGDTPTSADGIGGSSSSKSGNSHPKRDALFGQVLADRYRVLDLIGKGGMGKVYLAEHVALGKRVAVKVLNPAYTHRPDQVKRFLREAQAASTINHENVIDITDFGEMANGSVFFAMEHLQGDDLGKLLKKNGALSWPRARRILLQICRALQAAHAHGIIHRDMKPENIFIIHRNGMRDFVKVLDFGIAKFLEENRQVSHTLTQAGALIGTPEYMAPEQVQGEAADVRMDIYAVGCIMYQLLTGQLPFSDKTMFGVLSQQVNVKPVPPRQLTPDADIPPEVEVIILKAMEKERPNRFQSMAELIEALVAAPRGTSDARGGTTSNLEAAASAARMAAAMSAANPGGALTPSPTPQDMSFPGMSNSGALAGSSNPSAMWPEGGRDPAMMVKVVIALAAVVLLLVIGLVYALTNKTDDPSKGDTVATKDTPSIVEPPVTPPGDSGAQVKPPDPTPIDPTAAADDEGVVLDPEPEPTKVPTKKDPVKKDPGKRDPKKDPGKSTPRPETPPELERLEPFDLRRVLSNYSKDVESCRAAKSAQRGAVANIKLKIEGATGRVLEATPTDSNVAGPCIAKFVKAKAKFPRFKLKAQDTAYRFQM